MVEKRLVYMTPDWKDAFKYAVTLGEELGMEEAIASSPGWSETGGPWVPPSQGMKKYTWSETEAEGGKPFLGIAAHPPSNTVPYQSYRDSEAPGSPPAPQFYGDAAVVAYRRPPVDVAVESLHPKVTASGGMPDAAVLGAGDPASPTKLPVPAVGESAWIQFEFSGPMTMRSVTFAMRKIDWFSSVVNGVSNPEKTLEASDDGLHFEQVSNLADGEGPEITTSFPATTAKFFRFVFKRGPAPGTPEWMMGIDPAELG